MPAPDPRQPDVFAGYLTQIKDPHMRQAMRVLAMQVQQVIAGGQPARNHMDLAGNRVKRVAAPVEASDAVNKAHLDSQIDALRVELNAKNVENKTGKLREPQIPFLLNIPSGPTPDVATAQDGQLIRHQGTLKFFNAAKRIWEDV